MNKLAELRQKKTDSIKRMRELLDLAETEKRDLTADETKEYDGLDKGIDVIDAAIVKEERLMAKEEEMRKAAQIVNPLPTEMRVNIDHKLPVDPEKEFRNIGEYFYAIGDIKNGRRDKRLDLMEEREQQMGVGAKGGFALPEQFKGDILSVASQEAVVRPRATVIPAGSPPDSKLTMPALDQTSAQNIYGGVVVTHTGESLTMTETDANLRQVSLEPKEMTAYIVVSDKLLTNWDACSAFITTQLRKAMSGAEDYDFIRGNGVNRATGYINHAAAVVYSRAGASAIAFADVYGMLARAKMGGSMAWIASQTIIPQLAAMVDAGTHAVWLGGKDANGAAANSMPSTLMGFPILFADRCPALGSKGDLSLVDLSYYLVKDGSGPFVAQSTELLFLSNRTVFKVRWNVDGHPWLTEPIPLEGSTANTVSPFVVLE
jgi:HK97 family phage major capsid protein